MKPPASLLRQTALFCGDCLLLMGCWSLWLALGALFVVQIVIALSHEFALPGWMLRSLEERFAASGVQAQFGRATFNPTGGVLLENVSLALPAFEHPVIRARAVYLDLDPWLLLSGQVEPHRVHATGIQLFVPGMLTASGHDEEIVRDLEFALVPGENVFDLEMLEAHVAGVAVTAQGAMQFQRTRANGAIEPLPLLASVAAHFAGFCEQLLRISQHLSVLEEPQVNVRLVPSATRGAIAHVTLTARQLALPQFHALTARELRATTRFPVLGDAAAMSPLTVTAAEVRLGSLAVVQEVTAGLRGALNPGQFTYSPRHLELTARRLSAAGFALDHLLARIDPQPLPQAGGTIAAYLAGEPVAAEARVDLAAQTALLHFRGGAAPALLTPIGALLGHDVRKFFDYADPIGLDVTARFDPGWKFARVAGHATFSRVDAYRVPIDTAHGDIEFDGRHFIARHAYAAIGDNFARGSFEQDLKTKDYRFLLEGRLRPLAIGGWFHGNWWTGIFSQFDFTAAAPTASVDVTGRWFSIPETAVFVFAEAAQPVIRGAAFDHVRTRLFIRPHLLDGLEVFGTHGAGEARGDFTYFMGTGDRSWRRLQFAFTTSIDLDSAAKIVGPAIAARLTPFTFDQAPQVTFSGDFDGPGAGPVQHQKLDLAARTTGPFTFYRFPGQNLSFDAQLRDAELTVDHIRAEVAGGTITGHGRVWGANEDRRLGLDATLKNLRLHDAVATVTEYAALRRGKPAAATEKILSAKNDTKLDLALSAEGHLEDPFSFHGNGNAVLTGELGQVRLLGLLSELLNFTALRFTSARTDFKIEGRKITFPTVSVTGANSAIAAHGDYLLDRHELNFNARVYPFQESKSLLQSFVGVVLTPFSAVLEVKLTGPLDQPQWAFVIGPTNLLRSLNSTPGTPPPATPPAPPTSLQRETKPATAETH